MRSRSSRRPARCRPGRTSASCRCSTRTSTSRTRAPACAPLRGDFRSGSLRASLFGASASSRVSTPRRAHIPRATASFAKRSGYRGAHQKAAVDSVHFPLWRYNPVAEGKKLVLDSADKSDAVSFAYPPLVGGSRGARTHPKRKRGRANAVSKEFGENCAGPCGRLRRRFATYPPGQAPSEHLKQLVKKVGEEKAMTMLRGAPLQRLLRMRRKPTLFVRCE